MVRGLVGEEGAKFADAGAGQRLGGNSAGVPIRVAAVLAAKRREQVDAYSTRGSYELKVLLLTYLVTVGACSITRCLEARQVGGLGRIHRMVRPISPSTRRHYVERCWRLPRDDVETTSTVEMCCEKELRMRCWASKAVTRRKMTLQLRHQSRNTQHTASRKSFFSMTRRRVHHLRRRHHHQLVDRTLLLQPRLCCWTTKTKKRANKFHAVTPVAMETASETVSAGEKKK